MSAVNPSAYLDVLRVREAWRFDVGGLLVRMFSAMTILAVITTLTLVGWEFLRAGSVSTVLALAMFIVGPKISRAVDERGQSTIVPFAGAVAIAGAALMICVVQFNVPWWLCYVAALLMGAAPNAQSLVRTRWSFLVESGVLRASVHKYERLPEIKTVFAFEGMLDDAAYMLGPSIAIALSAMLFPAAGLVFAIVALLVGMWLLLGSRVTEPIPGWKPEAELLEGQAGEAEGEGDKRNMFFASAVVRAFFAILLMVGIFYGAHDTSVVALGEYIENPGLASILLLFGSAFSIAGSIIFGMLNLKVGLHKQMKVLTFLFSLCYGMMLICNIPTMILIVCTASALFFGPTLVIVNTLCERCVPSARLTESLTWVNAGFALGSAIIPTLTGFVVDFFGAWSGIHFAGILAWTVFLVALLVSPIVKRHQQ